MSRRFTTPAALVVLTAVAACLWIHRVYIDRPTAQGFGSADMVHYFYPVTVYMHNQLRNGELPLWNPYQLAGVPFVALHMPGPLYPPNLLLDALLRPARALEAHAVMHMVLAGLFTWLFAGRLGLGAPARLAAAFAFMLSGELLDRFYMVSFLSTLVWLPAIFWALHGMLSEARLRWALALSLVLALAFLGGFAQGFVYATQLAIFYGLYGLVTVTRRGSRGRVLCLAALCGVLTCGLTAAQLLPTLELTRQGVRTFGGHSLEEEVPGSLQMDGLLGGVLGDLWGEGLKWGERVVKNGPSPRRPVTMAVLTLPLLLCGLVDRRRRDQWGFFVAAAFLTGAFTLGPGTWIFRLYYMLPFGNIFRVPSRMAFVYVFTVAVVIGVGVQGASALLGRWSRTRSVQGALGVLLALAVAADLYARSRLPFTHPILAPERSYASPELIQRLRDRPSRDRVFVEDGGQLNVTGLQYKAGMMNEVFVVPDYEPQLPKLYEQYFNSSDHGTSTAPGLWHGLVNVVEPLRSMPAADLARLLDLMSVRYYAGSPKLGLKLQRELEEFAGGAATSFGSTRVVTRPRALPRVYVVHHVLYEPDTETALAMLKGASFDPQKEVVASDDVARLEEADGRRPEMAVISSYAPEAVVINATCTSTCLLVLTDLYYPGWEALVDGQETEIHRTNVLFRGVQLAAGSHRVVYRYRPVSFRLGSAVTLSTLVVLAGLGLWCGRSRRQEQEDASAVPRGR